MGVKDSIWKEHGFSFLFVLYSLFFPFFRCMCVCVSIVLEETKNSVFEFEMKSKLPTKTHTRKRQNTCKSIQHAIDVCA